MIHIALINDSDLEKLSQGEKVAVKAEDGTKHTLDGKEIPTSDISALASGKTVWVNEIRLIYAPDMVKT